MRASSIWSSSPSGSTLPLLSQGPFKALLLRWLHAVLPVFLATLGGGALAQAPVALNNPGFEGVANAVSECANVTGVVASGWNDDTCWDATRPVIDYALDTANPHSGATSQRVTLASGARVQFAQFLAQPLEALRINTVSIWLRSAAPMNVTLQLRQAGPPYQTYASNLVSVGTAWVRYQIDSVSDGGTAGLFVVTNEPGTIWMDDAALEAGTSVALLLGTTPAEAIPLSYFGMHLNQSDTPWPQVGKAIGSVRIWDAGGPEGSGTGAQWVDIARSRGVFDWSVLDARVAVARSQDADVLYTLGGRTPRWASSRPDAPTPYGPGQCAVPALDGDWRSWVESVARRYQGVIRQWEIWNEPDLADFFCGTPEQLVRMARIAREAIKQIDPQAIIVSPALSGYAGAGLLENFLGNGGGESVDVIAYHFYSDKPEELMLRTLNLKRLLARTGHLNKPLWNTEQGWIDTQGSVQKLPPETGAAYVARSLILNWALGNRRFYWYTWDNKYQLFDMVQADRITPAPPGIAYREVAGWMVGRVMESLERDSAGNFIATLRDTSGARQRVLWNPDATVAFSPPINWNVTRKRDVTGAAVSMVGVGSLRVGASPVILENQVTYPRRGRRPR